MITFAIPTWNRAKQLAVCIRSIAEQIREEEVPCRIVVSDHGSSDNTQDVLARMFDKYPDIVRYEAIERHEKSDFQDNFKHCFSLPGTEWTWTFGDDDVLLPGSLKTIWSVVRQFDGEFIRVAEAIRASEKHSFKRGTLLELCNDFGWLDMTGFITGNIVKSERLKRAVNTSNWEAYSKNAFPQSCALLEELAHDKSMFIDSPMVASQDKPEDDHKRWEQNNTATRYFYVDEGLQTLVEYSLIDLPVDNVFFRYHSYFLWDRLISNMISQYSNHPDDAHEELWAHVEGLTRFLASDQAKILQNRIKEVKEVIGKHYDAMNAIGKWSAVLNTLNEQHNTERFGFRYLSEPVSYPQEDKAPIGVNGFAHIIWNSQKRQRKHDATLLDAAGFPDAAKTLEANGLADFAVQA